jgi:hypothetical protein
MQFPLSPVNTAPLAPRATLTSLRLNDFGKAFKDAGFKFPKDDETFIKVPPVMLGAPAEEDLWPHTSRSRSGG